MEGVVRGMTVADFYNGKKVLITGHTGFKGSWLAEWLLTMGAKVTGLALPPPTKPALFDQLGLAARCDHRIGDIRDRTAVTRLVREVRPDFVFHLAAQPLVRRSYEQPVETYETNVMGTINVLEALREADWRCAVVAVTTDKVYENREWVHGYRECDPLGGHDPYSSSKAAVEIAVASWRRSFFAGHPVRIATARAGNVIGGGDWAQDRILPDCIRALARGETIPIRNPHSTRPWQHVLEPLSGYLWLAACLSQPSTSALHGTPQPRTRAEAADLRPLTPDLDSTFNFGPEGDSNRSVRELVEVLLKYWPGRWADKSTTTAVHEAGQLHLSIDKARALLDWAPSWSFADAVEQTVTWYRKAGEMTAPDAMRALTVGQIDRYTESARRLGRVWAVDGVGRMRRLISFCCDKSQETHSRCKKGDQP